MSREPDCASASTSAGRSHRLLRLRRGDGIGAYPQGPLDARDPRRRGDARHRGAREPALDGNRTPSATSPHGTTVGGEHGDPAPGGGARPLYDPGVRRRPRDRAPQVCRTPTTSSHAGRRPLAPRERVYGIAEADPSRTGASRPQWTPGRSRPRSVGRVRKGPTPSWSPLLHAYANPANERAVRDVVRAAAPDVAVTLSSDVWPVIREVRAHGDGDRRRLRAAPGSRRTSARSRPRSGDAGVPARPMITKSNGGIMAAELGKTDPVAMLLSGTASGVIGGGGRGGPGRRLGGAELRRGGDLRGRRGDPGRQARLRRRRDGRRIS